MVHTSPTLFSSCLCMLCVLCKVTAAVGVFFGPPASLGQEWLYSSELHPVSNVSPEPVILTLSSPPYRCLYPQPRVPRPRAKGLSAGWAQGSVPPPVCPANWGWSKRDPVLSAAPWAETCHARAAGNGPGLGANPEEAWKGLGWHVRPVRHAQNCEDCVIVRTRQSSQLPARLTLGSWPTRDWRNIMHNTF